MFKLTPRDETKGKDKDVHVYEDPNDPHYKCTSFYSFSDMKFLMPLKHLKATLHN